MNNHVKDHLFKQYFGQNKVTFLYLGLAVISLINVLLIIPLNTKMQTDFERARWIVVNQLNYPDANNWSYDLKHYFLNAGYFLSELILLNKVPANTDLLKKEFITHFFRLFDSGFNGEYQGNNLAGFDQLQSLYFSFNTKIQWFNLLAIIGIIGFIALTVWCLINSWRCYYQKQPYYFWTMISIYFFNIIGWWVSLILWKYRNRLKLILFNCDWLLKNQVNFVNTNIKPDQFIVVKKLKFSYGRQTSRVWTKWRKTRVESVLKGINLTIRQGSFNAILGNNGSGKSTLIKCLLNLETNYQGEINWNGVNLKKINPRSFAQNVAYFPQALDLPTGINVYDFVSFGRTPYLKMSGKLTDHDQQIVKETLIATDTLQFVGLNLDQLSGGQRQKVFIATILAQQVDTIVLDEPNTYLDVHNQIWLMESLKKLNQQGKTIILITHDTNQAAGYADHLIVLDQGVICRSGHPNQVIDQDLLTNVFGINAQLSRVNNRPFLTAVKVHETSTIN